MQFDVIVEKPLIHDGSGRVPYTNDVGISGNEIKAIGNLSEATAKKRYTAHGMALCPGFIDVHTHVDMALHREDRARYLEPMLRQGITSIVGGNCGAALAPISDRHSAFQFEFYDAFLGGDQRAAITWTSFGEMLETFETNGIPLNAGVLAPHGILRLDAMGDSTDFASQKDVEHMQGQLAACLEEGALGLSTGLMYFPGLASDQRELQELARVVHDYNGVYASHLRSYNSDTLENAIDEALTIGHDAEVPVQISHLFWVPNFPQPVKYAMKKAINGLSWLYAIHPFPVPLENSAGPYLEKIGKLADQGIPVGVDAMPTSAGFTHLFAFFPPWSLKGGMKMVLQRIADPETRAKIRTSIEKGRPEWPHRAKDSWSMNLFKVMGWDCASVMSVGSKRNQHLVGKTFVEIGRASGRHPFDAACDLALEEEGRVLIFETATWPGDPLVERILRGILCDPNVSVATDTIPISFGRPSHLFYDCYPKFLSQYTVASGGLSLPEAIRKCTSLPASQLGIRRRGLVKEGYYADLVVFDPYLLNTNATATDPEHFPDGVRAVFVNGRAVVDEDGYHPQPLAGKVIRRGE